MYVRRRQKIILGVSLIVIACLLGTGTYVYLEYYATKKETPVQQKPAFTIDNRISPLENQGVVLEVLRIRHRGLLQKLITPGNSWENVPTFYFISEMDGLEYISKDVTQHGRTTEVFFHTWDTMFQENKIMKKVQEENKTAQITLTIVERVKTGLFGLKTSDIKSDSFSVTYDFRTGRWSGQDSFKDYDGYGYYLGETFEIWFNIYQIDSDNDFIPYWTEVNILGTDPTVDDSKLDPDGDGIPTAWEWKWGYDPFTWDDHAYLDPDLDGLTNLAEYQMANWFADPFIQDIYIEIDIMGRGGPLDPPHYFFNESKQGFIERFAEHNIKVFIDDGWPNGPKHGGGDILPHIAKMSQDSGMILQFYNNYFPAERRGIFRYVVMGHGGGYSHPAKNDIYDCIEISYYPGKLQLAAQLKEFFILGRISTERGLRVSVGAQLMHEIAHSCSVDRDNCEFGGIDNMTYVSPLFIKKSYKETWGQYHSVLNYPYLYKPNLFDLSSGKNGPPYDQNDWGYIFCGNFHFNSRLIEQPYYEAGQGPLIDSEWRVTGYIYDANLTKQFVKYIGDYSPMDPIQVNWSVYRLIDYEQNPNARIIKVFAQPKIKSTQQWVLYQDGDLDLTGNMRFYSFDDILKQKTQ